MLLTRSDRLAFWGLVIAAAAAAVPTPRLAAWVVVQAPAPPAAPKAAAAPNAATPPQAAAAAQAPAAPGGPRHVVSSQINVSRNEAVMQLGFDDGRQMEFAIRDGRMFADGADLGPVPANGAADRSWRSVLARVMDAPATQVPDIVRGWSPPAPEGALKSAILSALAGQAAPAAPAAPMAAQNAPGVGPNADTLAKLQSRLEEMQQRLEDIQQGRELRRDEGPTWMGPFRYVWRGVTGIIGTLVVFAILVALGIVTVFFGGRPYLEAVADTARRQTARSWVVGLAGSFLVLPAFVLGILALTISIVGIPALLVFVPLFPVAVILGALFGYLGVAHAAGEALAERRLNGGEWFRRGNSYYFLVTGIGLLLALFLAAHVVEMAGPWLGFIHGLLTFLACVTTWFAFTTGFGAVLLTRGGTRPTTGLGPLDADVPSGFEEETHV